MLVVHISNKYRISSNSSQAIISIFAPKGGDYSKEAIITNISHWRSCPKYFVLLYQTIKEKVKYMNITIEKTVLKTRCFCNHMVGCEQLHVNESLARFILETDDPSRRIIRGEGSSV